MEPLPPSVLELISALQRPVQPSTKPKKRSKATHPKDRWDLFYVYMFIRKFTNIVDEIPSFLVIEDLENALLEPPGQVSDLLEQVVLRFILNLRPNTRNTSSDLLPSTLSSVLHELPKDKDRVRERTIFWDYDADTNVNPLKDVEGGFWFASWELKTRILRQLVDWQLVYSSAIRDVIDTAWQSRQKPHKKKAENPKPAPESGAPLSRESLTVQPIGLDKNRLRYWIADGSPRLYNSTNPWKLIHHFKCVAQTRDEYIKCIEDLRADAPPEQEEGPERKEKGERPSGSDNRHWELIYALELRVDEIEKDLVRVAKARKKLALDAERAAREQNAPGRRSRLREQHSTDDMKEELAFAGHQNGAADSHKRVYSGSRHDSPMELDDNAPRSTRSDGEGQDDDLEEIDELEDDSSLNKESGEEGEGERKRRKKTFLPSRISNRKRQRRTEDVGDTLAANRQNGVKANDGLASPDESLHGLRGSKNQNTKFWYFGEDDGKPAKKPEMLDDPDSLLRRRASKKERSSDPEASIDGASLPPSTLVSPVVENE